MLLAESELSRIEDRVFVAVAGDAKVNELFKHLSG